MSLSGFILRIVVALVLGIVIGTERQWRQRMAGLRTNALVAVGAALFASISILMNAKQNPTQVAAYIVSGIGFLAGAVIFKEGFSVRGLNTAATLWATAAVGHPLRIRVLSASRFRRHSRHCCERSVASDRATHQQATVRANRA